MNQQFDSDAEKTVINQPASEATQVVSQPQVNVTQMAATLECPVCQTVNSGTEMYCSDCGFLLGSTPVETQIPEEAQEPAAKLVATDGREFSLRASTNTVGRVDADVLVADPAVSRKHAQIEFRDGAWWLTDIGSTNGTFIEGVQLQANQPMQLTNGAGVKFGTSPMTFEASEVVAAVEGTGETTIVVETEPVVEETQIQSPEAAEESDEVEASLPDASEEFKVEETVAEPEPVEAVVVEPEAPALVGKLVNITNPEANYPVVTGVNTIGRAPGSSIQIVGDQYVSSRHAEIECGEDSCTITDVGSTNGTMLNGNALPKHETQELKAGDEIAIGQGRYRFEA